MSDQELQNGMPPEQAQKGAPEYNPYAQETRTSPTYSSELMPQQEYISGQNEFSKNYYKRNEMAYKSSKEVFEMTPQVESSKVERSPQVNQSHDDVFRPDYYDKKLPERKEFEMQIRDSEHPERVNEAMKNSGHIGFK